MSRASEGAADIGKLFCGVQGEPIVGEDGVGSVRGCGILYHHYLYALVAEHLHIGVKLLESLTLAQLLRDAALLKSIVYRCLRVVGEAHRAYHQYLICCLHNI